MCDDASGVCGDVQRHIASARHIVAIDRLPLARFVLWQIRIDATCAIAHSDDVPHEGLVKRGLVSCSFCDQLRILRLSCTREKSYSV